MESQIDKPSDINIENQNLDTPTNSEVIIIGSGMAGIACAAKLKSMNIDSIILEARDRIGGRILTKKFYNKAVDVGPNFIHGASHENPLYSKANKLNT
jgi:monoamine oxidase